MIADSRLITDSRIIAVNGGGRQAAGILYSDQFDHQPVQSAQHSLIRRKLILTEGEEIAGYIVNECKLSGRRRYVK